MAGGTRISVVTSGKPWEGEVAFSQAFLVEAGPLIFLSGQVAIDRDGKPVGGNSLSAQTRVAFSNIQDLLEAAGSSLEDVIKLTYFVRDMSQWSQVQQVRAEFFPKHHPASTTVEVSRLYKEEYLIEIEAIAAVRR
jgi:2-iminobutanoate/2-iminopropanoate deaminase